MDDRADVWVRQKLPYLVYAMSVVTALALTGACYGQNGWQRLSCPDPAFSVEAPAGWQLQAVAGRGARLVPPDAGPVVELVTWQALHRPATAEKAAVEHEGVLGRVIEYRRLTMEEIEAADGRRGLVVIGSARTPELEETSIFYAWAVGDRHWVLGTFAAADDIERLRSELLDRMWRSFRPAAGPEQPVVTPTAPVPPPPPEPQSVVEPEEPEEPEPAPEPEPAAGPQLGPEPGEVAEPSVAPATNAGGLTGPVAPEVTEPPAPWIEHLNPAGFALSIPVEWEVTVTRGVIVVTPARESVTRRAVLIWPMAGADPGPQGALQAALARLESFTVTGRVATETRADGVALITATTTGGERIIGAWADEGGDGLLIAVVAPRGRDDPDYGVMAHIAASFRPGAWAAPAAPEHEVTGTMHRLRWLLPTDWQSRGGVQDDGGELSIDIEALSPDGDMRIAWQQPLRPSFRSLTPLLASLGWREGERYSVAGESRGLLVYRRRTPVEMVKDLLLPQHPRVLADVGIEEYPLDDAVAGLLEGDEAAGQAVVVRGESAAGPRERLYLVATARALPPLAGTCWDGAVLRADAPAGRLGEVVAVLMRVVKSARATELSVRLYGDRLTQIVERAQRALSAVPADLMRSGPSVGIIGVLEDSVSGGDHLWRAPADVVAYWSGEAEGVAGGEVIER